MSGRIGGAWSRSDRRRRSPPAELGRLWQPVECLHRPFELHGPHAGRQEAEERVEERGLAGSPGQGGDDEGDAAFDEDPERSGQLRIERAGEDQLDDRARRRWDVADGPPAPRRRGLGHRRSVRPGPWSVKRLASAQTPRGAVVRRPDQRYRSSLGSISTYHRTDGTRTRHPSRSPPNASLTSPRCSSRAATRSGAGAPISASAGSISRAAARRGTDRPWSGRRSIPPPKVARLGWSPTTVKRPSAGSASARASDYERLAHSRVLAPLDDKPVWSIVCFVVGRRSRGQGVANALLDAAIDYARDHGATTARGLPGRGSPRGSGSLPPTCTRARFRCSSGRIQGRRAPPDPRRHGSPDRPTDARPRRETAVS